MQHPRGEREWNRDFRGGNGGRGRDIEDEYRHDERDVDERGFRGGSRSGEFERGYGRGSSRRDYPGDVEPGFERRFGQGGVSSGYYGGEHGYGGEWGHGREPGGRYRGYGGQSFQDRDRFYGREERSERDFGEPWSEYGRGYQGRFRGGWESESPMESWERHGRGMGQGYGRGMGGYRSQSVYGQEPYGTGMSGFGSPQLEQGRHRGVSPKNYRRSDERIREDICDVLSSEDIDASDIEVQVKNGEVTLSGTVPSRDMKYSAERIADRCPGVNDINNQLRVKRPQSQWSSEQTEGETGRQASSTPRASASSRS